MKLKLLFLTVLSFALSSAVSGQTKDGKMIGRPEVVNRLANETAETFAKRNGAGAELAHEVIETEAWGNKKTIIAFYNTEVKEKAGDTAHEVAGYLFMSDRDPNTYRKIFINNFEEEGDQPKIESVFFANADKDAARELVVICSWRQQHYDVSGTLYGTYVFDDFSTQAAPEKMKLLKGISEKVSGGCDCQYKDGTRGTKKYETAAEVRAGLKKMGF
jgi:hypothetical protein